MDILKEKYSITELSSILQVTDHTLRYYEKEFSLNIPKNERGRRYYTTELANLMYQIKTMRDEGLEIKAIRNIIQPDSTAKEPPPVVTENNDSLSIVESDNYVRNMKEMKAFFIDLKDQMTSEISLEIATTKDHLSKEISKSKLELGACVENGFRKMEAKMEKHFIDVDRSIGIWREKNRKGIFKKLLSKTLK